MTTQDAEWVRCTECGERFEIDPPELGDRIYATCPNCWVPLTGIWYGPLPKPSTPDPYLGAGVTQLSFEPAHSDGTDRG